MISYIFVISIHSSKKIKNIINSSKSTYDNCCDYHDYSENDICIVGDSHAYRYLVNIIMKLYKNGYKVYFKYVYAKWIVQNNVTYLYNIIHKMYLIISINMMSIRRYGNGFPNKSKYYNNYIIYLKSKCKYLIVYKPTPTFNFSINCRTQLNKRIGIIGYNISLLEFQLNINYSKNIIFKNLAKYYCYKEICNLTYNNNCIYSDVNHLSPSFLSIISKRIHKEIYMYLPVRKEKNLSCKSYTIYNNRIPYNWLFLKKNCMYSLYKASDTQ